jgi:hypothetical protein
LELDGRDDFDGHDGLENDGFRLEIRIAERADGGDAERKLRRVDRVEYTIAEDHANPRDRVPRQCTLLERLKEALLDRRDVVAWYVPAHYDALERCVRARFAISLRRLNVSNHMRVLPRATCSLLVHVRKLCSLRNHFAECDLRTPRRAGDAVLALHSLDINVEVELAYSQYDCLTKFRK